MHRAFSVEQESVEGFSFDLDIDTDLSVSQPFAQLGLVIAF